MASDISFLIFDPRSGAMVRRRWLGMGGTRNKAREVLGDATTKIARGHDCWSSVAPADVARIAEARYVGGAEPAEVEALARRYPPPDYWWLIDHDY